MCSGVCPVAVFEAGFFHARGKEGGATGGGSGGTLSSAAVVVVPQRTSPTMYTSGSTRSGAALRRVPIARVKLLLRVLGSLEYCMTSFMIVQAPPPRVVSCTVLGHTTQT